MYRLKAIKVKTVVLYILIIKRSGIKSRLFICSEMVNYDIVSFFKNNKLNRSSFEDEKA